MAEPAVLTKADLPEIIQRYRDGESLQELAQLSRRSRQSLWHWMLAGIGDAQHEQVVTECLVNRVMESDELIDSAVTMLDLARAREKAKFTRMDLERRRPSLYGPKQEIKSDSRIQVIIQRETPQPVVVEAIPTSVSIGHDE